MVKFIFKALIFLKFDKYDRYLIIIYIYRKSDRVKQQLLTNIVV
jgi:hypothetical protein